MSKAIVDYGKCKPEKCENGICVAALECPRKILKQDLPNDPPYRMVDLCTGCATCATACPCQAICMV